MRTKNIIRFLCILVCMLCLFGSFYVLAADVSTEYSETFDYTDGMREKWTLDGQSNWNGSTLGAKNKKMSMIHNGKWKTMEVSRTFESQFDGDNVLVTMEIIPVKTSGTINEEFPVLFAYDENGEKIKISGLRMLDGELSFYFGNESEKIPFTVKDGVEYTVGFYLNFDVKTQDIYVTSLDGDYFEAKDKPFISQTADKFDGINFKIVNDGQNAEYLFDNVWVSTYTEETFNRFESVFNSVLREEMLYYVKLNLSNDDVLIKIGSPTAIAKRRLVNIDSETEVVPVLKNSTTFVPVRFIAEHFGATVNYDAETERINILYKDTEIGFKINEKYYFVNGTYGCFENPIETVNGRAMVPLRFIAETFGRSVSWQDGLIAVSKTENLFSQGLSRYLGELDALLNY